MKITIQNRFWGSDGAQYGELHEDGQIVMVRRDCITWFRLDNGKPLMHSNGELVSMSEISYQ